VSNNPPGQVNATLAGKGGAEKREVIFEDVGSRTSVSFIGAEKPRRNEDTGIAAIGGPIAP